VFSQEMFRRHAEETFPEYRAQAMLMSVTARDPYGSLMNS